MIKVIKEKFKELHADEDFKKSLRQDIQAALSLTVIIVGLIVFASGRGCAVQDLNPKTGEPGNHPTPKAEAPSQSESSAPPLPFSWSEGVGKW